MRRLILVLIALLILSCGGGGEKLSIGGSTTVQPLSERWAGVFSKTHTGLKIDVMGGGSTAGVKGVIKGTLDIGGISRELEEDERNMCPELRAIPVALDAIAIIVNPKNPVEEVSLEELSSVFCGEIIGWEKLGGPSEPIIVVSREEGSGTRKTFEEKVLKGRRMTARAEFFDSNAAVKEKVKTTPWAIGYISLGYADESVKILRVNGIPCTPETARSGKYPLTRKLYYVVKGEPKGIVREFINFVLSDEGQKIVEEEGYIRVR